MLFILSTAMPILYATPQISATEIQTLYFNMQDQRTQVIKLFNQYTLDQNLHIACPKTSKHQHCHTQLTWKNTIKASVEQTHLSALRDKAVFQQIKVLIKSKADFKQRFMAFKQAESNYLNALANLQVKTQRHR